jgi:cell division septal protein FtsQ
MKLKNTNTLVSAKAQSKTNSENDSRRKARRKIWLRLAAIFLVIVFLASECATLLPVE